MMLLTCFAILAVLQAETPSGQLTAQQEPSAEQLLDRVAKTYAACKTYQDTGTVKTVFISAEGERMVERPFSTAFVRPDRFRFEFKQSQQNRPGVVRYIVSRKDNEVQTWWDVEPGIQKVKSLSLALAGATGVSGGSAYTVPALLLPDEVKGRRLTELTSLKRIDDSTLQKNEFYRVADIRVDRAVTFWIEKKTFVLWRIDSQISFNDFRTEEITTYSPKLDGEVRNELLEFNPPEKK